MPPIVYDHAMQADTPHDSNRKIPTAVVQINTEGIYLTALWGSAYPNIQVALEHVIILEMLMHNADINTARAEFNAVMARALSLTVDTLLPQIQQHKNCFFTVQAGAIRCLNQPTHGSDLLLQESRRTRQLLHAAAAHYQQAHKQHIDFDSALALLQRHGFIAPAVGSLQWGDLRRLVPICTRFGFSRGSPIDRYYLEQFIKKVRPLVCGDVIEMGGRDSNRSTYAFEHATRYRGFDTFADPDVSLMGDAHNPLALPEAKTDVMIAFNVLEHCAHPWVVIENMHRWLTPGGIAIVMVPSAQRLHRMPEDYWRPLPAALAQLFATWSECTLHVYGNPLTTIAALLGIAVEELSAAELDAQHPDYPVATCAIAKK